MNREYDVVIIGAARPAAARRAHLVVIVGETAESIVALAIGGGGIPVFRVILRTTTFHADIAQRD